MPTSLSSSNYPPSPTTRIRESAATLSATQEAVAARLVSYGLQVEESQILTSGAATASWVADRVAADSRILVVGEGGLLEELREVGMYPFYPGDRGGSWGTDPDLSPREGETGVTAVVVGLERAVSYGVIAAAQAAIRDGALYVATNIDATYPVEGAVSDCGLCGRYHTVAHSPIQTYHHCRHTFLPFARGEVRVSPPGATAVARIEGVHAHLPQLFQQSALPDHQNSGVRRHPVSHPRGGGRTRSEYLGLLHLEPIGDQTCGHRLLGG